MLSFDNPCRQQTVIDTRMADLGLPVSKQNISGQLAVSVNTKLSGLKNLLNGFNPYPSNIFCPENVVCFLCLLHIFKYVHFRIDFIKEAKTMSPDQTAP